jgi:hypothetical protein
MILNQISVERVRFTCTGCGQTWTVDYGVQHVEDGYGHDRDYYSYDGLPCPDPTAPGATLCPACSHGRLVVTIAARRATPAVAGTRTGDRGTRPGPSKTAERAAAPLPTGTDQGQM